MEARKIRGNKRVKSARYSERACVSHSVAQVNKHCYNMRRRGKLEKQAQGENQMEKRSEERGRKRGGDTNTKGAKFLIPCVGGKRRNQIHKHCCSTYRL